MTTLKIAGERCFIKHEERSLGETAKALGIELPDAWKSKSGIGSIVQLGGDVPVHSELKVGDRVVFPMFAGYDVRIDDARYQVVHWRDVMCKVEE